MKLFLYTIGATTATWANWQDWGTCTGTCYQGRRTRERLCSSWDWSVCENECQFQPGEICEHTETDRECPLAQCVFDQWADWSTCSQACGGGTQERQRTCGGSGRPALHCGGGDLTQTQDCNMAACVTYSYGPWSNWDQCTATCGGGTRTKTRVCDDNSGNTADPSNCGGPDSESEQCAMQDCVACEFNQWTGYRVNMDVYWNWVVDEEITSVNDCSAYCAGNSACKAFAFQKLTSTWNGNTNIYYTCKWSDSAVVQSSSTGYSGTYFQREYTFGLRATEDASQTALQTMGSPSLEPCGVRNDVCLSMDTDFGNVKYKDITNNAYQPSSWDVPDLFILRDANTADCAKRCWEKAGCTSYYVTTECNMIMSEGYSCDGYIGGNCPDPATVTESGRLSNFCSNTDTFTTSFVKKSVFYCELFTQIEEDQIIQQLKDDNGIDASTTLGSWTYQTLSNNPLSRQSQLIDVFVENPYGTPNTATQAEWTWIQFTFETHIRTANSVNSGRRRRSDIEDIFNVDQDAINGVLTELILPAGVTVNQTTPVEVVQFSQVTPSGTVAADCSSGTCECVEGFQDNGNGCEFTPAAVNVQAAEEGELLDSFRGSVESLLDNVNFTGKQEKQNKKRRILKNVWKNVINSVQKKELRLKEKLQKHCELGDVDEDKFVLSGNGCEKIDGAQSALDHYAMIYTNDCTKEVRKMNLNFHKRITDKLDKISSRTKNHLKAGDNC